MRTDQSSDHSPAPDVRWSTLLVVDDEPTVRQLVARMLEHGGYEAIEASGPAAALATLERDAARIRGAVIDIMLPEMGGRELAAAIASRWPHVRLLYMTGFPPPDDEWTPAPLMLKPFSAGELMARVALALATSGRPSIPDL
jgi:CheY-like chemotaxis protein